jgi:O-antigen biosynthesis protein
MYRFPAVDDVVGALVRGDSQKRYESWVVAYDTLRDSDLATMRDELAEVNDAPCFTVVIQTDMGGAIGGALERSLGAQVYERWEIQVVDAAKPDDWHAALRSAAEYVVVVEPDVVLRPHSLGLFALLLTRNRDAVLMYADEDEIDERGRRSSHDFKPDWNEALLRSQNYFGGLVCIRRADALAVTDPSREVDDGALHWDLFLRLTAQARPETIHHLPFILSHRLRMSGEVRRDRNGRVAPARALQARLQLIELDVEVEPVGEESFLTQLALPKKPPMVSVIIPTMAKVDVLRPCVDGLLSRTLYPELEVLLVVNGVDDPVHEQRAYLESVCRDPRIRVLDYDNRPYNFAATNNWAVAQSSGEILCFLNDDTDVIAPQWLSAMVSEVLQDGVAAAGAMLVYPNGRIQHAGVTLGAGGIAAHTYRGRPLGITGYHDRAVVVQDLSCVTAACMVIRRDAFSDAGCFDPALAIAFNDVDLCLRLRRAGWRIVWTPLARLYHNESTSIGRHSKMEKQWSLEWELMESRWQAQLQSDPHYNPNLSLDGLQLWEPAFPPRVLYPWRSGADAQAARD